MGTGIKRVRHNRGPKVNQKDAATRMGASTTSLEALAYVEDVAFGVSLNRRFFCASRWCYALVILCGCWSYRNFTPRDSGRYFGFYVGTPNRLGWAWRYRRGRGVEEDSAPPQCRLRIRRILFGREAMVVRRISGAGELEAGR